MALPSIGLLPPAGLCTSWAALAASLGCSKGLWATVILGLVGGWQVLGGLPLSFGANFSATHCLKLCWSLCAITRQPHNSRPWTCSRPCAVIPQGLFLQGPP